MTRDEFKALISWGEVYMDDDPFQDRPTPFPKVMEFYDDCGGEVEVRKARPDECAPCSPRRLYVSKK